MEEHFIVDNSMTPDWEVVPLGPVDKDGCRVPLDTTVLYGPRGEHYKVKSFMHFPLMSGWFMECAFTKDLIDVSSLYLMAPDSWEKLEEALDKDEGVCGYLGKCPKVMDKPSCSECRQLVLRDIASRIRKLRGEVREDA